MTNDDALQRFVTAAHAAWGPLETERIESYRALMEGLARSSPLEPWLGRLLADPTEDAVLHRDADHGFQLRAHIEREGRYRVPHDHGDGWVIYAVQHGEMEMSTFAQHPDAGDRHLVRRETYRMRAGDCRVFLPGDIHDTRCLSDSVLMLRLTSTDLREEERAGRLTRYPEAAA
ncbi:MAG: hypothetical protein H6719_24060 [Sandaracinaceae bacterium]|nr:hypothetical protein [Sandaracinaceae bacterium]